jgi:hypothetical protein
MRKKSPRGPRVVLGLVSAAVATVALTAGPASANAGGTNGSVWIGVAGNRDYVSEVDAAILNRGFDGHFHIYAGDYSFNTGDQHWNAGGFNAPDVVVHPNRNFFSGTLVCAEAWERTPGGYNLLGRPCETVEG